MFISWQTFEGSKIMINAIAQVTKFLLSEGVEFILTERFFHDKIEEYFGNQRQLGRVLIIQIYKCLGIMTTRFVYKKCILY